MFDGGLEKLGGRFERASKEELCKNEVGERWLRICFDFLNLLVVTTPDLLLCNRWRASSVSSTRCSCDNLCRTRYLTPRRCAWAASSEVRVSQGYTPAGFDDKTSEVSSLLKPPDFRVESETPRSVWPIWNPGKEYM